MKQQPTEKYQIAWFKLSEFIRRKQKERALGMYKLLMHSVEDPAFAKQVEADILYFFEEPKAIESYVEAAETYKKMGKLAQATAIYEHLIILEPKNTSFIKQLTNLYGSLHHPTRITFSLQRLIAPIVRGGNIMSLINSLEHLTPLLEKENQAALFQTTIQALLRYEPENTKIILSLIEQTIKKLINSENLLKKFITYLETVDKEYQYEALLMSKKIKNETNN